MQEKQEKTTRPLIDPSRVESLTNRTINHVGSHMDDTNRRTSCRKQAQRHHKHREEEKLNLLKILILNTTSFYATKLYICLNTEMRDSI